MTKTLLKAILAWLLVVAGLFIYLQPVSANNTWIVDRFHADIAIQEDGLVSITETIQADFRTDRHGIYRYLPYRYQGPDNKDIYTKITIEQVLKNNIQEPYETSDDGRNLQIKIGDSRIGDLKGKFTYKISYKVEGIILGYSGFDELYWNATGHDWDTTISQATATVKLPKPGLVQQSCYQGVAGSKEQCPSTPLGDQQVRYSASQALASGQGLTVAAGFDKGMVPLLTVAPPTLQQSVLHYWEIIVAALITTLLGVIAVWVLWYKRGRDWWWQTPGNLQNSAEAAILKPLGRSHPIVVEYTPPQGLTPGLVGLLKDEKADTLDIVATIIDLASRGYLKITELEKTWVFGSQDYQLDRTDKSDQDLLAYEKTLLSKIFGGAKQKKMSELRDKFYKDLSEVKKQLEQEAMSRQLFVKTPTSVVTTYWAIGFVTIFAAFLAAFLVSRFYPNSMLIGISIGFIIPAIALIIAASHMPQKTAQGRDLWRRIQGYRLFISTAEQHRQQFSEQQNIFSTVLPYAIVFGLTKKFAKAMEQIEYQPAQPSWYSGNSAFSAIVLANSMNKLSTSMSYAIASSPSSSGSGGGGSSGGGFGGGGGGSW